MKRFIRQLVALVPILAVFVWMVVLAGPVFALTTADVSVNATPAYVSISNSPDFYEFGVVEVSTNYSTAQAYFTLVDGSSVNIDITISCNATWGGGVTWTHDDSGTPGSDTAALYASADTGAFDIVVKNASVNNLVTDSTGDFDWELRLMAPTEFTDGAIKENTVTLTATLAP